MSAAASPGRAATAQTSVELRLTARRGENLLAVAIIPVVVLVFFSTTGIVETPGMSAVEFLLPGSLALAVVAAGLVNLGIATAYERHYGVLKRLGGSPLGRSGLVAAKVASVAVIVILQTILLVAVAIAFLGWSPGPDASAAALVLALALGTAAFAGLGLLLAGTLRAEATLALANGLFIAILLLGGIVVPVDRLPAPLATLAGVLPGAALSDTLRMALGSTAVVSDAWVVLAVWAVVAIGLTVRFFRWD